MKNENIFLLASLCYVVPPLSLSSQLYFLHNQVRRGICPIIQPKEIIFPPLEFFNYQRKKKESSSRTKDFSGKEKLFWSNNPLPTWSPTLGEEKFEIQPQKYKKRERTEIK